MAYVPSAYNPALHKYYQAPYFQQPYSQGRANRVWEGKSEEKGDGSAFESNAIGSGINDPTNEAEAEMQDRVRKAQSTRRRAGFQSAANSVGLDSNRFLLSGLIS